MSKIKENIVLLSLLALVALLVAGAILIEGQDPAPEGPAGPAKKQAPAIKNGRYLGDQISFKLPAGLSAKQIERSILLSGTNRGVINVFDLDVETSLADLQRQYQGRRLGSGLIFSSQPGVSRGLLLLGSYRVDYLLSGPGSGSKVIEMLESSKVRGS